MDIQQLRQSLKIKWVNYYYKNRSWLVKMRIWGTYDGQRRPSSSFILATLCALEPQLEQIFPFILDLNKNPDKIVAALGLNFNPEEQLHLVEDNFVAENQDPSEFSVDKFVTDKSPSKHISDRGTPEPQLQDTLPCSQPHAGDRKPLASSTSPTKIQLKDKHMSSVTPAVKDPRDSPVTSVSHKPDKPVIAIAIPTEVQDKSEPSTPIPHTKVKTHSVIPINFATRNEVTSKPLGSVAVATRIEHQTHSVIPITAATKIDPHRRCLATTREENLSAQVYHYPLLGTGSPHPIFKTQSDAVIPIADAGEIESQDKLVGMEQKDIPNHPVNLSPTNKTCKLANWIDDFCQGTGWDREEAIFIPF